MADRDNPLLDGFNTVQAVRRARPGKRGPKFGETRTTLPAVEARQKPKEEAARPVTTASHIGHTIVPEKSEIVCYECGYTFTLTGKIVKTYCPKCRTILEAIDHVIATEWTGQVKTVGTVEVKPGGVIRNSQIFARNMILAGRVETSTVRVLCRLELAEGAAGDILAITARDLVIRADSKFFFKDGLTGNNIEVQGELRGRIVASGRLIVRPGGYLRGDVLTPHLIVEEGGGLKANLCVGPAVAATLPGGANTSGAQGASKTRVTAAA